ncbi:hypothetical protein AJ79_04586 [Helicocarpus griseus UAMH5409]|uniref:Ubiquitin-like protease family profile domain-containing protein n=1 Tax=Helicocarpus griseus UAMH5409 TaxID=1447875 RepID=A0A2B7XJI9_9EURO|nr:hypothetical protein AJ79_04586 [Helicocarpus griseus UAMH5409]
MSWIIRKIYDVILPNSTPPNPPQTAQNSEHRQRRRKRPHPADDFEDIIVPVQMSGASNEVATASTQINNRFNFGQLGKSSTGVSPASSFQRDNPNSTPRFTKLSPQSEEELQEERRLLGGSSRKDPDAVLIKPGIVPRNGRPGSNLKSFSNFAPRNTLSSGAYRKPASTFAGRQYDRLNRPVSRFQDVETSPLSEQDGSHPRKRQRTANRPSSPEVIEVDDDQLSFLADSPATARPVSRSQRPSSQTSSHLDQSFSSKQKGSQTKEFWGVEDLMQDFKTKKSPEQPHLTDDEEFTMKARSQRKGENAIQNVRPGGSDLSRPAEKMVAVEVSPVRQLDDKSDARAGKRESPERLANTSVQTDGQRRNSNIRDSPDELQGGITIGETWRARSQDHGDRKSSDIIPTNFSLKKQERKRPDNRYKLSVHISSFRITAFDDKTWLPETPCTLIVNTRGGNFYVQGGDGAYDPKEFNIQNINQITHGGDKATVKFPKTHEQREDPNIQFLSEKECVDFCMLAQELNTHMKISEKDRKWMDNSFNLALKKRRGNRQLSGSKRESPRNDQADTVAHYQTQPKRQRISDRLINGNERAEERGGENTLVLEKPRRNGQLSSPILSHSHPDSDAVLIPVKPYKPSASLRTTRSKAQQNPTTVDSDHETSPSPARATHKWPKPLVYPPKGKKRAEVELHDLERLGDGEFLNDNLIGFYLRFLEHHMERNKPELAKRVYYFNSYFFASLTNTPKGKKGINYQAVEKWTRNVDIFSYEYIVVPINENAHWYMAIICNLPNLCNEKSGAEDGEPENEHATGGSSQIEKSGGEDQDLGRGDADVLKNGVEDTADVQSPMNGKEQILQDRFVSMSLSDKGFDTDPQQDGPNSWKEPEGPEGNEWPDEEENGQHVPITNTTISSHLDQSKPLRSGKERDLTAPTKTAPTKKASRKSFQCNPKQPVIITFDSLGCTRSPTIRILRLYLEEEGQSKRSMTVDTKGIVGMTARQIPHQPNYSDCGLYLLAYLEKFMRDPDVFIGKLVKGEMSEYDDWPRMESRVLRRRLRNFLLNLYDEEEEMKQGKSGQGDRMVDANPLKILLLDSEPSVGVQEDKAPEPKVPPNPKHRPPPTIEEKKTPVHETERKSLQSTPTRSSVRHSPNEQPGRSKSLITIEDDGVQQQRGIGNFLSTLAEFGNQDSGRESSVSEILETPPPHIQATGGIEFPHGSPHKTSPTSFFQRYQRRDGEIIEESD